MTRQPLLVGALDRARNASSDGSSSAHGSSCRRSSRSVIQASPIRSVISAASRVGLQQPAPRRDAVGLVVEVVRLELVRNRGTSVVFTSCAVQAATPLTEWLPTIARFAIRTCFSWPSSTSDIRDTRLSSSGQRRLTSSRKPPIDLEDDLQVPRQHALQQGDRPLLQRLWQQRVVRVAARGLRDLPRLLPR